MPHLSTMFGYRTRPGSFPTCPLPPSGFSITSTVEPSPVHSRKCAWLSPSIATRKRKLECGSIRAAVAIDAPSDLGDARAAGPDTDAHDDELGRIRRSHADLDRQVAERHLVGRIEGFVD